MPCHVIKHDKGDEEGGRFLTPHLPPNKLPRPT